jgi:hypothetical protein
LEATQSLLGVVLELARLRDRITGAGEATLQVANMLATRAGPEGAGYTGHAGRRGRPQETAAPQLTR